MGIFDIFTGITKQVNSVDIQRKKDEIDSLYNEMLTITDKLTETAKKIKDLKDQIKNNSSSDTKSEEAKKEESSTETVTGKTEPVNNKIEEGEGESEGEEEQPVAESPTTQPLTESPATQPAIKPTEMPAFGSTPSNDSLFGNSVPLSALPGTTPAAAMPPAMPAAMPGAMPAAMPGAMPGATQQNPFAQIQPQNQGLGSSEPNFSSELGGGKKNRKNKTATTAPKRKRRTRRNKKVMAQTQGQSQGETQGESQGEASV